MSDKPYNTLPLSFRIQFCKDELEKASLRQLKPNELRANVEHLQRMIYAHRNGHQ